MEYPTLDGQPRNGTGEVPWERGMIVLSFVVDNTTVDRHEQS